MKTATAEDLRHRTASVLDAVRKGLRDVDALIAATVVEAGCFLATANVRHYREIARLDLVPFRP